MTVPDLADRLGLETPQVRRLLDDRRLIAVRRDGVRVVPGAFLVPGHLADPASARDPASSPAWAVLASLAGTITVLGDAGLSDDETVDWLFTIDDQLGCAPIEALRAGRKVEVRRRAALEL